MARGEAPVQVSGALRKAQSPKGFLPQNTPQWNSQGLPRGRRGRTQTQASQKSYAGQAVFCSHDRDSDPANLRTLRGWG